MSSNSVAQLYLCQNIKWHFVDAVAGAGKTFQASTYACRKSLLGNNIVIIQPSKDLLDETEDTIFRIAEKDHLSVDVTKIHSDTNENEVVSKIVEYLKGDGAKDQGKILLITQAAYIRLPHFHMKDNWTAIWDEVTTSQCHPIKDMSVNLSSSVFHNHFPLFEYFTFTESDKAGYYFVEVNPLKKDIVAKISKNENNDDLWSKVSPICQEINSEHSTVYALQADVDRIRESKKDSSTRLHLFSILKPSQFEGFASITFMSALLKNTDFFHWFRQQGVKFAENKTISKKLNFHEHQDQVQFRYLFDIERASLNLFGKEINGTSVLNLSVDSVQEYFSQNFSGEKFVFSANLKFDVFSENELAVPMPFLAHGRNEWSDINHCAILGAYNGDGQFTAFADMFGMDKIIEHTRNTQQAYQVLMRTSLRDSESTAINEIILPTKKMCEELYVYFPNATISQLPNAPKLPDEIAIRYRGNGKIKKGSSDYFRKKTNDIWARNKKAFYDILSDDEKLSNLSDLPSAADLPLLIKGTAADGGNLPSTTPLLELQFFTNLYRHGAQEIEFLNWDSFIEDMKYVAYKAIKSKEENVLFTPARFDKKKVNKARSLQEQGESVGIYTKTNITDSCGLVFDVDGGDLSPEMWMKELSGIRVFIHNSHSNDPENNAYRYRVIIPTAFRMTVDEYELLTHGIARHMTKICPNSGIDTSKLSAGSLFFIPAESKFGEIATFFTDNGEQVVESISDLNKFIIPETVVAPRRESRRQPVNESIIEKDTIERYKGALTIIEQMRPGHRNSQACQVAGKIKDASDEVKDQFYVLMRDAGVDQKELNYMMKHYANYHNVW